MYFSTDVKAAVGAAIALAALIAGPLAVAGPPEGKGKPDKAQNHKVQKAQQPKPKKDQQPGVQKAQQSKAKQSAATVSGLISVSEARRLAVGHNYIGYQPLPPGIRKNLARGKPLPPGIAKKTVPGPMLAQLPVRPGYDWYAYGRNLVWVAVATGVIADVLLDVFE